VETINVKYSREFWVRIGIVGGIFALIGLLTLSISRGRVALIAIGVVPTLIYVAVMVITHRRALKTIDTKGVNRRDGKRLLWSDFRERRDVQSITKYGQPVGVNNIDLLFGEGKARLFPHVIDDAATVLAAIEKYAKVPVAPANCTICSHLHDEEYAMQKVGREDEDTQLPPEVWKLQDVRELKPGGNRSPILKKCPECHTFYVYRDIYDYLATGSEDEQRLTRLNNEVEAAQFET